MKAGEAVGPELQPGESLLQAEVMYVLDVKYRAAGMAVVAVTDRYLRVIEGYNRVLTGDTGRVLGDFYEITRIKERHLIPLHRIAAVTVREMGFRQLPYFDIQVDAGPSWRLRATRKNARDQALADSLIRTLHAAIDALH